ncbi:HAD family hydrolase [Humibacter ginsenosidimutans]|uniref:Haloacid dehalogenase-like hydrolase n=1 Tax=Humibacter ginsenosidimutans TaxID=2599293 RepID=A0A5B8M1N9_9MICO|nr:HAD family hydrolase [Humibacter ginsenosidimutans]QDZ14263.1 haloacid dehalogenase-like hydrolase [Humibacter ginsenosidimutans]
MSELAMWRDGATRRTIVDFVRSVTSGPDAVPAEERIAVFDNDGTLWTEKPMQTQLHYIIEQWTALAKEHPELAEQQPFKAVVEGDLSWLGAAVDKHYAGDDSDLKVLIGALLRTMTGLSVEDYAASVTEFYRTAQHLTLHRPYRDVIYQPMVELLDYLAENGFTCYIVSGGDRDFMRPITQEYYGIPFERVIGTAIGLEYADGDVRYGTTLDFFDDGPEKPVRIWTRIGRRPLIAAGNSNGDIEMLSFVQGGPHGLSLLVHHDDDTGRGDTPYDKGAEKALATSEESGFTVVSVKDDWSAVFPPESA